MYKKMVRPLVRRTALAIAISFWVTGIAGAEELATADIPVTEVEVKDKKLQEEKQPPEGSAENGYRFRTAMVGPLGTRSLQDTPFSINAVSAELIENMQAQSSSEALRYNPTVQATLGSNRSSNYFMIRGFSSSPGITGNAAVDGMRASVSIEPVEDKERIEVMNGPAGFLYGFASPGGVINYVLKRPTSEPLANVTVGNYGGAQAYIHGDFGGPLGQDGKLAYRLNVLKVNGGDVGIEDETQERQLVSGAIDWHIDQNTVWSFDASHFESDIEHQQAIFLVGKATVIPSAPDLSRNYGAPYNFTKDSYTRYGTNFTSKLNDIFTVRAGMRHTATDNRSLNMRGSWINNAGDYTFQMQCKGTNQIDTTQGNVFLDAAFRTGAVAHKTTFGWTGSYARQRYSYPNGSTTYVFPATYLSNMEDPSYPPDPNYLLPFGDPMRTTEKTRIQTTLLADQLTFTKNWSMFVGANYTTMDDESWNVNTGAFSAHYRKSKLTPSVALMYKPFETMTTYVSYVEGLQAGPTAPSTAANSGEVLEPYMSRQVEVGVKSKVGKLDINTAIFRINKANTYSDPDTKIYSLNGKEVHTGGEVVISGKVTDYLTIGGGFTLLNAEIEKTDTLSLLHKSPLGVPEKIARLYAEYTLPKVPALTLTGGVSYTGKEWVDSANTLSIPSAVLLDFGARYRTKVDGHDVTMRLNVYNATNKRYWTDKGDSMIYPGTPRTVTYSVEYGF